jgi:hypothetical protein
MRLLTILFLFWPITIIGAASPDALPPYGTWKCTLETAVECEWADHEKLPDCKFEKDGPMPLCIDLRSTPYAMYFNCDKGLHTELRYIGPEDGMWTLSGLLPLGGIMMLGINPRATTIRVISEPWGDYWISDGSCIRITPKDEEKKPADKSNDKGTSITPKEPDKPVEGGTKDTPTKD